MKHLFMCLVVYSYISFCEVSVQSICPLFYWVVLSSYHWAVEVLYIFWIPIFLLNMLFCKYFLSVCDLSICLFFMKFNLLISDLLLFFVLRNLCLSKFRKIFFHVFSSSFLQLSMVLVAGFCKCLCTGWYVEKVYHKRNIYQMLFSISIEMIILYFHLFC